MYLAGYLFEILWVLAWVGAVLTVPSVLQQRAGRPVAALSWLLALFALPAVALVAWWLFGRTHLRRKRRHRRWASESIARSLAQTRQLIHGAGERQASVLQPPPELVGFLPPGPHDTVFPATGGNRVDLLPDAASAHRAWQRLVEGAGHHVHLLFYIWRDDATGRGLRDLLVARAGQGVAVRVLYDAVGSLGLPRGFFDPLRAAGGKAAAFMPLRLLAAAPTLNFRNHRKLLIADGGSAYTGGINVGDEYLGWQDIGITIRGPGVNQLQEIFVDDWYFTTGEEVTGGDYFCEVPAAAELPGEAVCETVASGPDQTFNATREMVFLAVTQCRRLLWIATSYFVPDSALLLALRSAAYRGVDARLFLPARSDARLVRRASRVFYKELMESGVRIFEYQGMLHTKAMLLDESTVLVGSANLDTRSFRLNFELSTFITDVRLNRELAELLSAVEARSREVSLQDLRHTSPLTRLEDGLAHLLSPLL
jgi:cardiolipin synthase